MAVCAAFPTGTLNDTAGNTLGCRLYHAGAPAISNATLHCPHASPTGGSVCGDYCESYCSIGTYSCNPANGYDLMSGQDANCQSICTTLYPTGTIGQDTGGNSLACRLYHAEASITLVPAKIHCTHASPSGNLVCSDSTVSFCETYCAFNLLACTGANAQYASESACSDYCTNNLELFQGSWNDTGGDTIGCRLYHSTAAVTSPSVHCPHSGPSGDNICGTWCQVYCDLVEQNCVGGNSQYTSNSDCMSTCAGLSTSGKPGDTTGDTIQCRIYHAGVAGNPITNAQVHCPHAGPTGGGQCGGSATTGKSDASSVVVSLFLVAAALMALLF